MNNGIKVLLLGIFILFLALYFGKYTTNYYENQKVLTDEAILKFEKDLKDGKEIIPENYIVKEKNYNNKISKIGIKTSKFIENSFHKILKFLIKELNKYT